MNKKYIVLLFFLLIFSINGFSKRIYFEKGKIDLTFYNFNKNYILYGEWEFYWQSLYTPSDLKNINPKPNNFVTANGSWENYKFDGKKVGKWGYATYKLTILAPKGEYAIFFHQVVSAYKVWINDSLLLEHGKVGTTKESSIPKPGNNLLVFKTTKDTIEIVIQVSNFHHTSGGLQEKVYFGKPQQISEKRKSNVALQSLAIGAELIFVIFFIGLFVTREKNINYLIFALGIILLIVFEFLNGEAFILSNFPNISWNTAKKIDFFSSYLRLSFFTIYYWLTFRNIKLYNKKIIFTITAISVFFSIIVLFTKSEFFSQTLIFFIVFSLLSFLYLFVFSFIGILKKVQYSLLTFLSVFLLLLASINDSLFSMNIINTGYFMSYGLVGFITFFSIIFSLKYTKKSRFIDNYNKLDSKLRQIFSEIILIESYNLPKFIKILNNYINSTYIELWIKNNQMLTCELVKEEDDNIKVAQLKDNFTSQLNYEIIEEIIAKKETLHSKNEIFVPIYKSNEIKAFLYFKKFEFEKFSKEDVNLIENLLPYISNTIENYEYYYEIKSINENLEMIVESRTELIYEQKDELKQKVIEISSKYEEFQIVNKVINDINLELKNSQADISKKNDELFKIKTEQELFNEQLTQKNTLIQDSLMYAKYLRNNFLKSYEKNVSLPNFFSASFSKNLISGDFYCLYKVNNTILISLFNTTATDVVSVFLSFLLSYIIDEIIEDKEESINQTKHIVKEIDTKYKKIFNYEETKRVITDSFKLTLCSISFDSGKMSISLVGQDLVIIRRSEPIKLFGSKMSIGGIYDSVDHNKISQINFDLQNGDMVYLYTEGVHLTNKHQDQEKNKETFINELAKLSLIDLDSQNNIITEKYKENRADTTILGIKYQNTILK